MKIHQSWNLWYHKIRRRDGVETLTTLEEGEFKVPIDGCIKISRNVVGNYKSPLHKLNTVYKTVSLREFLVAN